MPKKLKGHEMVPFDKDVVIIGGRSDGVMGLDSITFSTSLYRFTCQNQDCEWRIMSQELKIGRNWFVAMVIPDELVECGNRMICLWS